MASTTLPAAPPEVRVGPITGGVDTHLDVHVAAALDGIGGLLGTESFPTTPAGYRSSLPGCRSSDRWSKSASKAPAATGPA